MQRGQWTGFFSYYKAPNKVALFWKTVSKSNLARLASLAKESNVIVSTGRGDQRPRGLVP